MKRDYKILPRSSPTELDYERAQFPQVKFTSITRTLTELSKHQKVACPKCGGTIDFNQFVEWYGPSHFTCRNCERLVHVRRIDIRK